MIVVCASHIDHLVRWECIFDMIASCVKFGISPKNIYISMSIGIAVQLPLTRLLSTNTNVYLHASRKKQFEHIAFLTKVIPKDQPILFMDDDDYLIRPPPDTINIQGKQELYIYDGKQEEKYPCAAQDDFSGSIASYETLTTFLKNVDKITNMTDCIFTNQLTATALAPWVKARKLKLPDYINSWRNVTSIR